MSEKALDLRGVICPMNFVKAKLFLENFGEGEVVEIILDEGDPLVNVTRSLKEEGHKVIKVEPYDDLSFRVFIERGK